VHIVVSIHAPVKGATLLETAMPKEAKVSIHAPVKGATVDDPTPGAYTLVSIHAPVKGATIAKTTVYAVALVSIHAPVKGATPRDPEDHPPAHGFNPRAREGRDKGTLRRCCGSCGFQSTRP